MKLVTKSMLCFLLVWPALHSCTKPVSGEDVPQVTDTLVVNKEYLFALQDGGVLEEGDSVSLFLLRQESAQSLTQEVFVSEGGVKLPLELDGPDGLIPGDILLIYSPHANIGDSQNLSDVVMSIPPVQQQVGTFFDLYPYPLAGVPFVADSTLRSGRKELAGEIVMNHLYAIARFDICIISQSYVGQKVESLTWTASSGLSGEFTVDLMAPGLAVPAVGGMTVVTEVADLTVPESGNRFYIYMAVAPGTHSGVVTLKIDGFEISVPVKEQEFKRGAVTDVDIFVQGDILGDYEPFNPLEGIDWSAN